MKFAQNQKFIFWLSKHNYASLSMKVMLKFLSIKHILWYLRSMPQAIFYVSSHSPEQGKVLRLWNNAIISLQSCLKYITHSPSWIFPDEYKLTFQALISMELTKKEYFIYKQQTCLCSS